MKIYVRDGEPPFVHDPTPDLVPVLKIFDATFDVRSIPPPADFVPRFQVLKRTPVESLDRTGIHRMDYEGLKGAFLESIRKSQHPGPKAQKPLLSALDLLEEIGSKLLRGCNICGRMCGVDRFTQKGACGLQSRARVAEVLVHIAEEAVINPAVVINMAGCGMNCVYCISHEFKITERYPVMTEAEVWNVVAERTRTRVSALEFGTGCIENLPFVTRLLRYAPEDLRWPVVMNCHLYINHEILGVFSHIADVWLVDLRYFNDTCGMMLSRVKNYLQTSLKALRTLLGSSSRIIVRILVLPGHFECCYGPMLQFLASIRHKVWVSVLDQYVPEHQAHKYPVINRRPNGDEIRMVEEHRRACGLRDINEDPSSFWVVM